MRVTHFVMRITWIVGSTLFSVTPGVAQGAGDEYRVSRPDSPGPHPAVVLVPGCSGFKPAFAPAAYERPAEQLRAQGFVVVWADYLGRRNLTNCAGGGVTQEEAGRDAVAAASWVKSQPDVDPKRITAIGWSWGGGSLLAALGDRGVNDLVLARAILYFPYCQATGPRYHQIPVLVLRGGSDTVASPQLCEPVLRGASGEAGVKIVVYPGAFHAFDASELPPKVEYQFGTVGYDPKAAAAAWREVLRFLEVRN